VSMPTHDLMNSLQPIRHQVISPYVPADAPKTHSADPTDVSELSAPAPEESAQRRGWGRIALAASLAAVGVIGLAGCSSGPPPPPPVCTAVAASSTNQAAAALEAQSSQDVLQFHIIPEGTPRIDIVRQTETERDSDGDTREEDVAYAQTGVYLGGGLFHDAHGNLSLIPSMAFEDFHPSGASTTCVDGPWGNDYRTYPAGDGVLIDGPWKADQHVTREGDVVRVDGPWSADHTFIKSGDTVRWDGPWGHDYTFTRSGSTIHSDGPWGDDYTVRIGGRSTTVDAPWNNDTTITREGNQIRVDGPWGRDYTISREGNMVRIDGPLGADYTITRDGNVMHVDGPWGRDYRIEYTPR